MSNNFRERDKEVQKKKRKKLLKNVKKIVKLIGIIGTTFSAMTGMSFFAAIRMVSVEFDTTKEENTNDIWYFLQPYIEFILDYFIVFLAISFIIIGIFKLIIIPSYQIHKENRPPLEAYPTILAILFQATISCLAITMCFFVLCLLKSYMMTNQN